MPPAGNFAALSARFDRGGHGEHWLTLQEYKPLGGKHGIWFGAARNRAAGADAVREALGTDPTSATNWLFEYDAYDDDAAALGTAVVCLTRVCGPPADPRRRSPGIWFRGRHVAASNGFYEWWAGANGRLEDCIYHICVGDSASCQADWSEDPTLTVIHIDSFRAINGSDLVGTYAVVRWRKYLDDYLSRLGGPAEVRGMRGRAADAAGAAPDDPAAGALVDRATRASLRPDRGRETHRRRAAAPRGESVSSGSTDLELELRGRGDGADVANRSLGSLLGTSGGDGDLDGSDAAAFLRDRALATRPGHTGGIDEPPAGFIGSSRPLQAKDGGRSATGAGPSPSEVLREKAAFHVDVAASSARKDSRSDTRPRKRRRSRSRSSDGSDDGQVFRDAGTSSVIPLVEWARLHPGELFWQGLKEQSQFTSTRAGRTADDAGEQRVGTYLNQVLLAQHPPARIGAPKLRELMTLQMAMDTLLDGNLALVGDILMQRFKAVEGSLNDGGWELSRHMELVPPSGASSSSQGERERAGRAALREAKLAVTLEDLRKKLSRAKADGAGR